MLGHEPHLLLPHAANVISASIQDAIATCSSPASIINKTYQGLEESSAASPHPTLTTSEWQQHSNTQTDSNPDGSEPSLESSTRQLHLAQTGKKKKKSWHPYSFPMPLCNITSSSCSQRQLAGYHKSFIQLAATAAAAVTLHISPGQKHPFTQAITSPTQADITTKAGIVKQT